METTVLDYRIIIEEELQPRTKKRVYVAYCPKLGVSDWGSSIEEAHAHIQGAIECYIESLVKHKEAVPAPDSSSFMVTTTSIRVPPSISLSYL